MFFFESVFKIYVDYLSIRLVIKKLNYYVFFVFKYYLVLFLMFFLINEIFIRRFGFIIVIFCKIDFI